MYCLCVYEIYGKESVDICHSHMVWRRLLHVAKAISSISFTIEMYGKCSNFCPVCFTNLASCGFQVAYFLKSLKRKQCWLLGTKVIFCCALIGIMYVRFLVFSSLCWPLLIAN